jgi:monoamine oxidase
VRPAAAAEVESWSDERTVRDVCAQLRALFPSHFTPPLDSFVTRWAADPFSLGAYSFVPVGGDKRGYEWLGHPLTGDKHYDARQTDPSVAGRLLRADTRLFFAGEATSRDDACTVHGAFESGRREAGRVARWWKEHRREVERMEAVQVGAAAAAAAAAAAGRLPRALGAVEEVGVGKDERRS